MKQPNDSVALTNPRNEEDVTTGLLLLPLSLPIISGALSWAGQSFEKWPSLMMAWLLMELGRFYKAFIIVWNTPVLGATRYVEIFNTEPLCTGFALKQF